MPSEQVENYIKNIYKLQEQEKRVTTSLLSDKLQISAPSVSEMVRKLAEEGTVSYTPYKGVELTSEGTRQALKIIRRHRLWELFLVEVLKYQWDEIDEEAERLEHFMSEKLEERIDEALGFPRRDPHGDLIPTREGILEDRKHVPLSELEPGSKGIVSRVSDEHPEVLQYMSKLGIVLGTLVRISERIEFDGSLRAEIGSREQFISAKLAQNIFVEAKETVIVR